MGVAVVMEPDKATPELCGGGVGAVGLPGAPSVAGGRPILRCRTGTYALLEPNSLHCPDGMDEMSGPLPRGRRTYKREVIASEAVVASNHPLASAAGAEVLCAGGNAVDAAWRLCLRCRSSSR